jgi:hypothetical protein
MMKIIGTACSNFASSLACPLPRARPSLAIFWKKGDWDDSIENASLILPLAVHKDLFGQRFGAK